MLDNIIGFFLFILCICGCLSFIAMGAAFNCIPLALWKIMSFAEVFWPLKIFFEAAIVSTIAIIDIVVIRSIYDDLWLKIKR